MTPGFPPAFPIHLLILAALCVLAGGLARWARRAPAAAPRIARGLGVLLAVQELVWYGYVIAGGGLRFPYGLPLDLCDVVLWLTVIALLTGRREPFEIAYYWGLAGTGLAILTPDVGGGLTRYEYFKFFLAHGGVVASILFLAWSGRARPRPGSARRAFLWLNGYAALLAGFNLAFGTNYMYLCRKPAAPTLLDWLGPWPWYLLSAEILAVVLFALLGLPWRARRAEAGCTGPEARAEP